MDGRQIQELALRTGLALPAVTKSQPFGPEYDVLKIVDKVFLLTSEITIGSVISLKCEPEYAIALRQEHESIVPGYHLNKRHWISIGSGASITPELLRELVLLSYTLVLEKLPKRRRPRLLSAQEYRAIIDGETPIAEAIH